jgi:hypothetical protein
MRPGYVTRPCLIPCVALVRRLPVVVQVPLVAVAAWIAFGMTGLFFQVKLI